MQAGGQAVRGLVASLDDLLLGLELLNRADGAKDFLLDDGHVLLDVAEDGGLDKVAFFAMALTADFDFGAGFFALINVAGGDTLGFQRSMSCFQESD